MLPLINEYAIEVFQQDNARPQIAQISKTLLQQAEVEILPWPARSSNLNSIEHCCGISWVEVKAFSPTRKEFGEASLG
jgi:hypothetical protein